jgi:hypothetical protein
MIFTAAKRKEREEREKIQDDNSPQRTQSKDMIEFFSKKVLIQLSSHSASVFLCVLCDLCGAVAFLFCILIHMR